MGNKSSTDEFIKKSKSTHGNKYDYSLVEYKTSRIKVKIICPHHGIFHQVPAEHIYKKGCPKCGGSFKLTTTDFISKSIKLHCDKYDYSLVKYVNNITNVNIICLQHGIFKQVPSSHLQGRGCPKCMSNYKLTTQSFIEKAIKVHDGLYEYSSVNYINSGTKIKITCKKHGIFKQIPSDHLQGKGCSTCNASKGELTIYSILKRNNIEFEREYIIKNFIKSVGGRKLRFDFCIPHHNILIEFDGIQHFEPVKEFGGIKGFCTLQENDKIKNENTSEFGYSLYRIKYNESIEERMKEILFKHGIVTK